MQVISSVATVLESIAIWLNPERKEKIILRKAIGAAEELLMIYRKEGKYKSMSPAKLLVLEVHYNKQWLAWKDGLS
jgi:hypothetical protein